MGGTRDCEIPPARFDHIPEKLGCPQ
jgi:hypothetical protein